MDESVAKKLEEFFTKFRQQHYKKGEMLIRAEDDPSGIFYLTSGTVRKYVISQKGDELVVNIFKPISFFPMSWAINNTPNEYFYEAFSDVTLYRAPKEQVISFVRGDADVLYDLLSRVYKGTDGMETRMTYLMAGNAYARLITELIITAKRFGTLSNGGIDIHISEKDLGTQSGMTRETVSREMHALKNHGLVNVTQNSIHLKSIEALKEELEQVNA